MHGATSEQANGRHVRRADPRAVLLEVTPMAGRGERVTHEVFVTVRLDAAR